MQSKLVCFLLFIGFPLILFSQETQWRSVSGKIVTSWTKQLLANLKPLIPLGLSAAIYTPTTDIELEVNGLMTYAREIIKFDPKFLNRL